MLMTTSFGAFGVNFAGARKVSISGTSAPVSPWDLSVAYNLLLLASELLCLLQCLLPVLLW